MSTPSEAQTVASVKLVDVNGVAEIFGCSSRHVYRLSDAGKMPRPVKLGALVRWRLAEIQEWIAQGCPAVLRPGQARQGWAERASRIGHEDSRKQAA